jgi:hypothetical protein
MNNEKMSGTKDLISLARENKKVVILAVAALVLVGTITYASLEGTLPSCSFGNKKSSASEVEAKILSYIEETLPGTVASIEEVNEMKGENLYEVELVLEGQEYISYTTLDGKFLFPQGIDLDEFLTGVESSGDISASIEAPKTERPDVKLFVMSYCPYGLQAEKGLLPAWDLLKEKADIGVYFVNYIMHDKEEIDENLRQYCISENQPEKIIPYLQCFVADGDHDSCLLKAGIDMQKLSSCEKEADETFEITKNYEDEESWLSGQFPVFKVHDELNEKYEIGGSPMLIINDTLIYPIDRSPESYKQEICNAFTEMPEECNQVLSTDVYTSMFGMDVMESETSGGSCE